MIVVMLGTLSAVANPKVMIIFDTSGRMWGQIDGINKIVKSLRRDKL